MKNDMKYLNMLAEHFPTAKAARAEIIRLRALNELPKGTEYFFSDLHGEDTGFIHILRSASGNIRHKISELFAYELTQNEQNQLANLIYDPKRVLSILKNTDRIEPDWLAITIYRLIALVSHIGVKYSWSDISSKIPEQYTDIITELLFAFRDKNKKSYINDMIRFVIEEDAAFSFIESLCVMVQNICVNTLHILGDIFDRGPGPHRIMEELMQFSDVDVQWGNHDIVWMGAAAGNEPCMAIVVRIGIAYNSFDFMEDGYGINLRPLSSFAAEVYGDDPCERFKVHHYDLPKAALIADDHAARMHKAISIIQFKLEGQMLERHPEWNMTQRNVLKNVDFKTGEYVVGDKRFPLRDTNFPTIDPDDPLRLTKDEEDVMYNIAVSFKHSEPLHRHVRFLYDKGSTYKIVNRNLLFHGCIPLTKEGELRSVTVDGKSYKGRALLDVLNVKIRDAYFQGRLADHSSDAADKLWYLWCGSESPMFGKSQMSTFENFFVEDKAIREEIYDPYYTFSSQEETCKMILADFGLNPDNSRIINGHVPVKSGETPVKANGRLYVIDGGLAKAYQKRTGINGYTLIFNSHHLALAEHHDYQTIENDMGSYTPRLHIMEPMPQRLMVHNTDLGKEINAQIEDLRELIEAFHSGAIKEQ